MIQRFWWVAWVFLVACDRALVKTGNTEDEETKTPLEEVGEIFSGEKPPQQEPEPVGADPARPAAPVAKPVPDKPGFVISPHNGKWIDVTGVPAGELMLDPHFPAEAKKYFRVPELPKPPPAEPEEPDNGTEAEPAEAQPVE